MEQERWRGRSIGVLDLVEMKDLVNGASVCLLDHAEVYQSMRKIWRMDDGVYNGLGTS